MYVFEFEYPGTWLEFNPKETAWEIQGILRQVESAFTEAVIAFNLFEIEKSNNYLELNNNYDEALSQKKEEILNSRNNTSLFYDFTISEYNVDIEARRQIWKEGFMPKQYMNSLIFIYARTFLFSLDNICKLIGVLSLYKGIPKQIIEIKKMIKLNFPNLIEVRNSAHHIEDRTRGLGRNGKKIQLKPIDNNFIRSDVGALILNSLNNNKYGCTMADGNYGEIEVSIDTLIFFRDSIQKILTSFNWDGQSEVYPR